MGKSKKTKVGTVSFVQIRKLKAQDRQRDWDRLARGEVTPEQLQAENAWVRNTRQFRILNSAQAARYFRRQRRRAWSLPGGHSPLAVGRKLDIHTPVCYPVVVVKSPLTAERDSDQLASIARRVCWWQSAEATLENTPRFLCQVMVFGTWDDTCFAVNHYGEAAFREALRSAPPGLFDNRSWHYWHHRLRLLPVPPKPHRAIPA